MQVFVSLSVLTRYAMNGCMDDLYIDFSFDIPPVIAVILCQAGGGIIVALVVKYADNIIKGFACSLATLLSTVGSMYLFSFQPSGKFVVGGVLVVASAFYYGIVDGRQRQALSAAGGSKLKSPAASGGMKSDLEVEHLLNPSKDDAKLDKL
jgi:hypothetical protein